MNRIPQYSQCEDAPRSQNAEINFMKLIACITIVFHHSVFATETESSQIWTGGWMSVAFFFCISGYLMAAHAFRAAPISKDKLGSDTVKFMAGRIKRILPYYMFAWIFSYILVSIKYGFGLKVQARMLVDSLFPTLLIYMAGFDGLEVVGAIWYLSAMYLVMPTLYAFLRARKDLFVWVVAPTITLFLYGYMHKVFGGIGLSTDWIGLCYGGILFAIGGLSCGCFCYGVSEWLKRQPLSKFSHVLVSLLDMGMFIICLIIMQVYPASKISATVAFLFAVVVIASFSGQSYTTEFFNRFCSSPLIGEFSVAIYLCHGRVMILLPEYFPDVQSYEGRMLLYVLFALLSGTLCVIAVRLGKSWYQKGGHTAVRRLFLTEKN